MRWLDDIPDLMDMSSSKLWEMVKEREARRAAVRGVAKSRTRLSRGTREKRKAVCFNSGDACRSCQGILCKAVP